MQIAVQAVMQSLHLEAGSTTFGAEGPCPGMPFPQVYLVRRVVSSFPQPRSPATNSARILQNRYVPLS